MKHINMKTKSVLLRAILSTCSLFVVAGPLAAVTVSRECALLTPSATELAQSSNELGTFRVTYDPTLRNQDNISFEWDVSPVGAAADSIDFTIIPHCFAFANCSAVAPFDQGTTCTLGQSSPPACCFQSLEPVDEYDGVAVGTASITGLCPSNCAAITAHIEVDDYGEIIFGTCTVELDFVNFTLDTCALCYGACDCVVVNVTVTNNTEEAFVSGDISFTVNQPTDLCFTGVCDGTNVSAYGTTITIDEALAAGASKSFCLCYKVSACPCPGLREILINDCHSHTIELVAVNEEPTSSIFDAINRKYCLGQNLPIICDTTTTVSSCCPTNPCKQSCCPKPTCCPTKTTCCPTTTTVSSCCPTNPCKQTCCPKPTCCPTKTTCCPTTTTVSSCCPTNPCKKSTCSTCCS